jgi:hypothetical protein
VDKHEPDIAHLTAFGRATVSPYLPCAAIDPDMNKFLINQSVQPPYTGQPKLLERASGSGSISETFWGSRRKKVASRFHGWRDFY